MKKITLILISSISFSCFSEPIKSVIGAYNISHQEVENQSYSAKDYVQDGLVAMWDGIENVGWGLHDPESATWVNLCGTGDFTISNTQLSWEDNALVRYGKSGGISCIPDVDLSMPLSTRTFEFVMDADGIPTSPSSVYYFWALDRAGIRCTCQIYGNSQGMFVTLKAGGGGGASMTSIKRNVSSFGPLSVSMVRTDEPYSNKADLNVGLYYLNGSLINKAPFGGYSTEEPILYLFRANRDWPEPMRIGMHCFRIYSRALTVADIQHNYEVDKVRFGL